ncbi:MAG: coenzyme F420-0:L-glutamate ligase [Actinomycetales bacterium]|nr:coenzyme F420-0:L-glutamate ligase [Actinomycetales bacterium]
MSARVEIIGLPGMPEVRTGDDLPGLLLDAVTAAGEGLREGDLLVVSSKVAAKAAGLEADSSDKAAVVAAQTVSVVAERATAEGVTRVVRSLAGPVLAAAGVDASNTGGRDVLLLLPHDPDAVCRALRLAVQSRSGVRRLGVILSDTAGRPWRTGVADFALGTAGVQVLDDLRGRPDADGSLLQVTTRALADEIAAAADLVKGKVDRTPAALVRGLAELTLDPDADAAHPGDTAEPTATAGDGGAALVRPAGPEDWFALGSQEAVRAALGVPPGTPRADQVGIRPVGPDSVNAQVQRAVAVALVGLGDDQPAHAELEVGVDVGPADLVVTGPDPLRVGLIGARLMTALAGEGVRHTVEFDSTTVRIHLVGASGRAP